MRQHWKSCPALIVPSLVLIVPLPVNRFPNKLGPNLPNNIERNLPFCYFASFLIVLLAPFVNKPDSWRDLAIFMILFVFSLEFVYVALQNLNIFFRIVASVTFGDSVNSNGIKTLSARGLSTFPTKVNTFLVIALKV